MRNERVDIQRKGTTESPPAPSQIRQDRAAPSKAAPNGQKAGMKRAEHTQKPPSTVVFIPGRGRDAPEIGYDAAWAPNLTAITAASGRDVRSESMPRSMARSSAGQLATTAA